MKAPPYRMLHDIDSYDDALDDFYLKPLSKQKLMDDADYTITVDVQMNVLNDGINYAFSTILVTKHQKFQPC